jgi:hypothetical protein
MSTVAKKQVETKQAPTRVAPRFTRFASFRAVTALSLLWPTLACSAAVGTEEAESQGVLSSELSIVDLPPTFGPVIVRPKPFPFPFPPPLPNPEDFLDISAGEHHTCARKRNGNVYCWGRDDLGQVGNSPNATCVDAHDKCIDRPTLVYPYGGLTTATQIDAGDNHACALDLAGHAFCWGSQSYGQTGNGTYGSIFEPVAVSGGQSFTSISAGTFGTCGTTASGLFCWGIGIPSNAGTVGAGPTPQMIYSATGLAPTGVSVGFSHVCAQWVSGAYRETNCWGRSWEGQTGAAGVPYTLLGQGPSVGSAALRVATEYDFTCVDQPGPSVQCFGDNWNGQLGNGLVGGTTFVAQQVGGMTLPGGPPPLALHGVTTGSFHACALDPNGAAYCWGNGNWGQLGNGLPPNGGPGVSSAMPAAVTGGLTFRAIAAGQLHTCAIGTNNHIYCWGSNHYGELGTQFKSSPVFPAYTNGWVADPVQAKDP